MNTLHQKLTTWGVRPTNPVFFWDFDLTGIDMIWRWAKENFKDFDIYLSSYLSSRNPNRFHLVAKVDSYDQAQAKLRICAEEFPYEHYIMNCRRLRLRVREKIDELGATVAPEPSLFYCHCPNYDHNEKRVGIVEQYFTRTERENAPRNG